MAMPALRGPRLTTTLRRGAPLPVWADLGLRMGSAAALILFIVLLHWFDREGLRDSLDNQITFGDVIYFTMVSITTTGFGDIVPVSDRARLVEALIVAPVRIAVLMIFVGTAYTFVIKRSWEKFRIARIQQQLSDHVVVIGFGASGMESVRELIDRGTHPSRIVVLDPAAEPLDQAISMGCNVMQADGSRDEYLKAVQIGKARRVLVSAGGDDTSILIVLTVRHLAPGVPISMVVRAADNEVLARQAGADTVINPVRFTGLLLAGSASGTNIADYLADLASVTGNVKLVEREVMAEEIGRPLTDLATGGRGLRILRHGRACGFWEPEASSLEAGDMVVEILPAASAQQA